MIQEGLALTTVGLAVFYTLWSFYKLLAVDNKKTHSACSACQAKANCHIG